MIGQVFTPDALADYMARLLLNDLDLAGPIRCLDPGAGPGTLTRALMDQAATRGRRFEKITLVESDQAFMSPLLELHDNALERAPEIDVHVTDFVRYADTVLRNGDSFTHIIMNPPYKKLPSRSEHAAALKHLGINVSNYYAAFLWLAIDLLRPGGRLVAVIPRSFTNGQMFTQLRRHILSQTAIEQITTFSNRDVFARDSVLQEIVVISLRRAGETIKPTRFVVAEAADHQIHEQTTVHASPSDYLLPMQEGSAITLPQTLNGLAAQFGELIIRHPFEVHTGQVVDFRHRSSIVGHPDTDTVPLIGSRELTVTGTATPTRFLRINGTTSRYIHPPGCYVVIKRISPPEQAPRIRARMFNTCDLSNTGIAFENHVNYVSRGQAALSSHDAAMILASLTHPDTDLQFGRLNGTTQVNVNDLRSLRHSTEGTERNV